MMVYTAMVADGFEWVMPVRQEDHDLFRFDGTSRIDSWTPVEMEFVHEDNGRLAKRSDFPWYGSPLVLRRTAVDALRPRILKYGELLPLTCDGTELWVYNVTSVIDGLDESKSEIRRFDDGRIMWLKKPVFYADKVRNLDIFKVREQAERSALPDIFYGEAFVRAVSASGLVGIDFEPCWSDVDPDVGPVNPFSPV